VWSLGLRLSPQGSEKPEASVTRQRTPRHTRLLLVQFIVSPEMFFFFFQNQIKVTFTFLFFCFCFSHQWVFSVIVIWHFLSFSSHLFFTSEDGNQGNWKSKQGPENEIRCEILTKDYQGVVFRAFSKFTSPKVNLLSCQAIKKTCLLLSLSLSINPEKLANPRIL